MLIFQNCFSGLRLDPLLSGLDNRFKFIRHSLDGQAWRIFATYRDAKHDNYAFQKELADCIHACSDNNNAPLSFDGKSWQWHHVFERTHLEPLYSPQDIHNLHERIIPCVLINTTTEHFDYSGLLHTIPAKTVFRLPPKRMGILRGQARRDYKRSLASMYRKVYGRDAVLTTVFDNILEGL